MAMNAFFFKSLFFVAYLINLSFTLSILIGSHKLSSLKNKIICSSIGYKISKKVLVFHNFNFNL